MSTTPTEILQTVAPTEEVLDIASIKELMDGFDPAALLPDLSKLFDSLAPVCRFAAMIGPLVLLVLGLAYLLLAPREANHYFGYRCYFGMGSVQAWRFTQRFAGIVLGGLGLALTVAVYSMTRDYEAMDLTQMVWQTVDLLVIEAGLALLANLTVNLTAFIRFTSRGEYRKALKKTKK